MPEGYTVSETVPAAPQLSETPPAPPAEPEAAAPPEEAESHPPSPPETPAEMAQSLAAIAEQVAGANKSEGYTVKEGPLQEGPNPIARLARRTTGPITVPPRMKPMRPAKRSSSLGLILIAGLVVGLLIAGYVFRDVIARTVPGADAIYSLLGLSADDATADLDLAIDDWKLEPGDQTGEKVFHLWGTVFNKSYYPVSLPPLIVTPIDAAGSQLEPLEFRLAETQIEPGQNIKFLKSFDNWPAGAPRFDIDWSAE
ncbi:hypothetical protein [Dongia deserti]|uniref:hypothetical protein n=1 Tax=Dongia deserti TaxID=2268030 RepID=UPI0025497877|nr:hypothetical protein [Dongia deserti]